MFSGGQDKIINIFSLNLDNQYEHQTKIDYYDSDFYSICAFDTLFYASGVTSTIKEFDNKGNPTLELTGHSSTVSWLSPAG